MKVKGCKHYESKVMKMAGGGAVPNVYSKKVPKMDEIKTREKSVPYMTKKNADGSQAYVRGEKASDRMKTLSRVSKNLSDKYVENWDKNVTANRGDGKKHAAGLARARQLSKADKGVFDQFMTENDNAREMRKKRMKE
jgi:hypothetical protein